MKIAFLLLPTACCLILTGALRADDVNTGPLSVKTSSARAKAAKTAGRTNVNGQKMIYYITSKSRAGSNIPMVYRQYGGYIDSASSPAVYGSGALRFTGAEDTGAILSRLEPSIMTGRGR